MGGSWETLGPSWGHRGPSVPSYGHLGPSWSHLGALLDPLVAILGPLGASMGPPWGRHEANLAHPGVFLGHLRAIWGHLGASWTNLVRFGWHAEALWAPFWVSSGPCWAILGSPERNETIWGTILGSPFALLGKASLKLSRLVSEDVDSTFLIIAFMLMGACLLLQR